MVAKREIGRRLAVVGMVAVLALGTYAHLGRPDESAQPDVRQALQLERRGH
jgi:hypothetical protein